MQKGGHYIKIGGKRGEIRSLVPSLHTLALVLSLKHKIHYLEHITNIFSQVDLIFPKLSAVSLFPDFMLIQLLAYP